MQKRLSNQQVNLLKALGRTGAVSEGQAQKFLNCSEKSISYLEKKSYCKKVTKFSRGFNSFITYMHLTPKGRNFVKNKLGIINPYAFHSRRVEHDFVLAHQYFLLDKNTRETWITEGELKEIYDDLIKSTSREEISVTDAAYISDGVIVCIEVISKNYKHTQIQAKANFINAIGANAKVVTR